MKAMIMFLLAPQPVLQIHQVDATYHLVQGAGQLTTTGDENIFLGQAAGYGNITGNKNICIGSVTHSNTDIGGNDSLNVIVGNRAGSYNAGSETVLIGCFCRAW
jgi:hypothetical protein